MAGGSVAEWVEAASKGDRAAWNALVEHFTPLVAAIGRRYRLGHADLSDVNQTVWLRLVEHVDDLRDPRALPKWIATVTRNECLRVIRSSGRTTPLDESVESPPRIPDPDIDEPLLQHERHSVLREAFAALSEQCRTLLALLMTDPPTSYADISRRTGMQVGSIGPTRIRCLAKLRESQHLRRFLDGDGDVAATVG